MTKTMGLLLVVALVGCASSVRYVSANPAAGQPAFDRDNYDCEKEMRQYSFGTGLAGSMDAGDFKEKCLAARGWTRQR